MLRAALVCGALVRLAALWLGSADVLMSRPEIAVPSTSFHRLRECSFLLSLAQEGRSQVPSPDQPRPAILTPYAGDQCHHAPLLVFFAQFIEKLPHSALMWQLLFVGVDAAGAWLLGSAVLAWQRHMREDRAVAQSVATKPGRVVEWPLRSSVIDYRSLPFAAALLYTLNPFGVASSVGLTTAVINNTLILGCIRSALWARYRASDTWFACALLACATYLSVYPLLLVPALAAVMRKPVGGTALLVVSGVVSLFVFSDLLLRISGGAPPGNGLVAGDFSIITETWGAMLAVTDLTPNLGLFWYLFTEVFEHFQPFYLFVYQYHVLIYTAPLYFRFQHRPLFLFWMQLAVISSFKAYPAVADVSLTWALLPMLFEIVWDTRYALVYFVTLVFCAVLCPILWTTWINHLSGNANFYYALGLVFQICQILFMGDMVGSVLKLDYLDKPGARERAERPLEEESEKDKTE